MYKDHKPVGGITATEVQAFLIAGNINRGFQAKASVLMHEGIVKAEILTILLQGNAVPK